MQTTGVELGPRSQGFALGRLTGQSLQGVKGPGRGALWFEHHFQIDPQRSVLAEQLVSLQDQVDAGQTDFESFGALRQGGSQGQMQILDGQLGGAFTQGVAQPFQEQSLVEQLGVVVAAADLDSAEPLLNFNPGGSTGGRRLKQSQQPESGFSSVERIELQQSPVCFHAEAALRVPVRLIAEIFDPSLNLLGHSPMIGAGVQASKFIPMRRTEEGAF